MKRKKCIYVEKGTFRDSLSFSIPQVSLAVVISILLGHISRRTEGAFSTKRFQKSPKMSSFEKIIRFLDFGLVCCFLKASELWNHYYWLYSRDRWLYVWSSIVWLALSNAKIQRTLTIVRFYSFPKLSFYGKDLFSRFIVLQMFPLPF